MGTITAYEDSSLNLGYYDFHSAVNRAISDFNSAPAYNPNFVTCTGGVCNYEIYTGSIPCQQAMIYYGDTPDDYYSSTGFISGIGYYAMFNRVHTVFNTYNAHWNNSLTWSRRVPLLEVPLT